MRKTVIPAAAACMNCCCLDDHLRDQIAPKSQRHGNSAGWCTGRGMVTLREDGFKKSPRA